MASTPASSPGSVVIDANVLIAICAREKDKFDKAQDANEERLIHLNFMDWAKRSGGTSIRKIM